MSDREELAEPILSEFRPPKESGQSWRLSPFTAADKILAAGYAKPRTIDDVGQANALKLADLALAYKGTPRHKLFEYPHRDDDSRQMIREAEALVNAILTVLYTSEPLP